MYKKVYNNLIRNDEQIKEKCKSIIEADKVIKTTFIHPKKEYDEKIKQRFKRQWNSMERVNKCQMH